MFAILLTVIFYTFDYSSTNHRHLLERKVQLLTFELPTYTKWISIAFYEPYITDMTQYAQNRKQSTFRERSFDVSTITRPPCWREFVKILIKWAIVLIPFNHGTFISDPMPWTILMRFNRACIKAMNVVLQHRGLVFVRRIFLKY